MIADLLTEGEGNTVDGAEVALQEHEGQLLNKKSPICQTQTYFTLYILTSRQTSTRSDRFARNKSD